MMKEVAIEIIEPWAFDLPDTAHFVSMQLSAEANQTNARIPTDVFANRRDTLFTVVGFPRRDPIAALRIERHFSAPEIRLPCVPQAKSLFLIGHKDCDLTEVEEIQSKFRWVSLDGSTGIILEPGAWHSTQCFPLESDSCHFLFMLDAQGEADFKSFHGGTFSSPHNEVVELSPRASFIPSGSI
jgi:hypothetical protein